MKEESIVNGSNKPDKEAIYKKHWAEWANKTFKSDVPFKPEDCDNEHGWVYEAMESFSASQISELKKENETLRELKQINEVLLISAADSLEDVQKENRQLQSTLEELNDELTSWKKTAEQAQDLWQKKDKEMERLKGLIEQAYTIGYDESSFAHDANLQEQHEPPTTWQQFKTENQL